MSKKELLISEIEQVSDERRFSGLIISQVYILRLSAKICVLFFYNFLYIKTRKEKFNGKDLL